MVNRINAKGQLWSPSKDSRVCSKHFEDQIPTTTNPYPTKNLGYRDAEGKVNRILSFKSPPQKPRAIVKIRKGQSPIDKTPDPPIEVCEYSSHHSTSAFLQWIALSLTMLILFKFAKHYYNKCKALLTEVAKLRKDVQRLEQQLLIWSHNSVCDVILKSDVSVNFFTGIPNITLFRSIHACVVPFVNRRWKGVSGLCKNLRKFINRPNKFGPNRKLSSHNEMLLTLMKIRLGLLNKDLASRFQVSESHCSCVFLAWIKALSSVLGKMVFIPDQESLIATMPQRFRHIPDLHSIIDCTEIFIETPKDLYLQGATWSDYKHHNTVKVLISCSPNSSIIFASSAYMGRISDKALTIDCGYLDKLPPYSLIMADKGFNITEECVARSLTLYVPPGKRGQSQMSSAAILKTKKIANLRILVEQVIRRLKTFRILKYEVPLTLVGHIDDIVTVCAALCNLKEPIYKN